MQFRPDSLVQNFFKEENENFYSPNNESPLNNKVIDVTAAISN
jgi:hypothetical protein